MGKPTSIMVVDDEVYVTQLLERHLKEIGYLVTAVNDANAVLSKLAENEPDLVLLDIKMPGKSGLELLPEIKISYPDTVVMMATAVTDIRTAVLCMKNGAYDYITKPFDLDEVGLSIRRALDKRRIELENRDYQQHLLQKVQEQLREIDINYRSLFDERIVNNINEETTLNLVYAVNDASKTKMFQDELSKSCERLQILTFQLQDKLDEQRKRISAEIHDELGQMLTALKINLSWLAQKMPSDASFFIQKTQSLIGMVDETDRIVKKISASLRPPLLDDLSLSEALKWLASQFQERTGINCFLNIPEDINLNKTRSTNIFRIIQEALTNVARHSGATEVSICLQIESPGLKIIIRDNGRGIRNEEIHSSLSYGLIGMHERAYKLGGEVKLEGIENSGTTIFINIPIRDKEE